MKVNKNADISIFLIKGGGYFLTNFHRICLYMQKSKHIFKVNYLIKGKYIKTIFGMFFYDKIVATALLPSLTAFL